VTTLLIYLACFMALLVILLAYGLHQTRKFKASPPVVSRRLHRKINRALRHERVSTVSAWDDTVGSWPKARRA
jgi:sulfite exporter TauE/SafE